MSDAEDDCPLCVLFGVIAQWDEMCDSLQRKGAPVRCNILIDQVAKEQVPLKEAAQQLRKEAKRLGWTRMVKEIDETRQIIKPHIRRQARGERLAQD